MSGRWTFHDISGEGFSASKFFFHQMKTRVALLRIPIVNMCTNLIIRNFPKAARLSQISCRQSTFKKFFQGPDFQSTFLNPSVLIVLPTA